MGRKGPLTQTGYPTCLTQLFFRNFTSNNRSPTSKNTENRETDPENPEKETDMTNIDSTIFDASDLDINENTAAANAPATSDRDPFYTAKGRVYRLEERTNVNGTPYAKFSLGRKRDGKFVLTNVTVTGKTWAALKPKIENGADISLYGRYDKLPRSENDTRDSYIFQAAGITGYRAASLIPAEKRQQAAQNAA